MTAVLEDGAESVLPVLDWDEANEKASMLPKGSFIKAGEYEGRTIEGFLEPYPSELKTEVVGKTVILSTTNGTVATRRSESAKTLFAASLLNGKAVSEAIIREWEDETVVLICSGSHGHFCLEDFYGAGYLIDCLLMTEKVELTDSAQAARLFYQAYKNEGFSILRDSRVGEMLAAYGFEHEVEFVAQKSVSSVVPVWRDGKMVVLEGSSCLK